MRMCYCMCMLDHRVQILLDETRYRRVAREAQRRGTSIAAVIRDALDRLPTDAQVRESAIAAVLNAEPMSVPSDPTELRRELDVAHRQLER